MREAFFQGSEGEVFYRVWTPEGPPKRLPELPVVVAGNSMGRLLAGRYAERYPQQLAGVAFLDRFDVEPDRITFPAWRRRDGDMFDGWNPRSR